MFIVKLSNPRPAPAKIGSEGMTIVTIIDDDEPGLIGFKDEETHATVQESDGHAHIFVSRFKVFLSHTLYFFIYLCLISLSIKLVDYPSQLHPLINTHSSTLTTPHPHYHPTLTITTRAPLARSLWTTPRSTSMLSGAAKQTLPAVSRLRSRRGKRRVGEMVHDQDDDDEEELEVVVGGGVSSVAIRILPSCRHMVSIVWSCLTPLTL